MDRAELGRVLLGTNVDFPTSIGLGVVLGLVATWVLAPNVPDGIYPLVAIAILLAIAVSAAAVGAGIIPILLVVVLPTAAFFPPGCGPGASCVPPSLGTILFDILFLVSSAALIAVLGYGMATVSRWVRPSNPTVAAD